MTATTLIETIQKTTLNRLGEIKARRWSIRLFFLRRRLLFNRRWRQLLRLLLADTDGRSNTGLARCSDPVNEAAEFFDERFGDGWICQRDAEPIDIASCIAGDLHRPAVTPFDIRSDVLHVETWIRNLWSLWLFCNRRNRISAMTTEDFVDRETHFTELFGGSNERFE